MSEAQTNQPILDNEGNDLHQEAKDIYESHGAAVEDQRYAENHDAAIRAARGAIEQALATDDEQDADTQLAATNIKSGLNKQLDEASQHYVVDDINAVQESVDEGREHYELNKEGYEQAAIQDATAAGHDISFGGEHYPAQQAEQPKGPEA